MHVKTEYLISPENPRRNSDDNILLSLKLTMSHSHEDHFSYGCFGRQSRARTPNVAGNNAHNNGRRGLFSMGQGGRTVLPPLHLPFRASRSPAPDPPFSANQQHSQQIITDSRSPFQPAPAWGPTGWPIDPTASPGSQHPIFPDPRYPAQNPNYPSYPNRASPAIPSHPHDSRTLPPLSAQQGSYFAQAGVPAQSMVTPSHARTTSFSQQQSQQYAPYPSGQTQQQSGYYPQGQDPRNLQSLSSVSYDPSSGAHIPRRSSMSVDRTVPSRMSTHGPVPYARIPPVVSPTYDQEPISEPSIKKKRKRADAEQLRVLNDTYNRTAFPSTEERIELAKKLGMSARSVQIWFQNKRQAMRQNNRQASNALPPTSSEPFTAGPAPNPGANVPPSSSGYIQQPSNPMNSISMSGPGYGSQRVDSYGRPMIPSPTPSVQYRGRSYDDHETLRRPSSRQH